MSHTPFLFTSESVGEGHPDKLCDQISDAVLDACMAADNHSRVACETFATTGMVLVGGEISTRAVLNLDDIVRDVVRDIGYVDASHGLDAASMAVLSIVHRQSPEIATGVDEDKQAHKEQGAGDQGMMFGYACDETPELMPAPIMFSHRLMMRSATLRKSGGHPWLLPDGKSQVTVEYDGGGRPVRIHTVLVSQHHTPAIALPSLREAVVEQIIRPVLEPTGLLDNATRVLVNPAGTFTIGGPHADTGLTGRKIIVDTYGGMGRHGGGAFSGKDPSKVDRSAAYMARYVAKNLVAAGLCRRCEVQFSYAIGLSRPLSVTIETFGTACVSHESLQRAVGEVFDLTPAGIIKSLDLLRPIYRATAAYGHFGRDGFRWEQTDRVGQLRDMLG